MGLGVTDPELTTQGAVESGETTTPAAAVSTEAGPSGYEVDGERLSDEQIREAVEAWRTRDQWNQGYTQRDQRFAFAMRALEQAFGKRLSDFTEADVADLNAFSSFNYRLRTSPEFRRRWIASLSEDLQSKGLSPEQAKAAAAKEAATRSGTTTTAETPAPPAISPEFNERMTSLESYLIDREIDALSDRIDQGVKATLSRVAPDIVKAHPMLRRAVLQGMGGYSDAELKRMENEGQLPRLIHQLATEEYKTLKSLLSENLKALGTAAVGAKGTSAPVRSGTVTAPVTEFPEARRGRGAEDMHESLRKAIKEGRVDFGM